MTQREGLDVCVGRLWILVGSVDGCWSERSWSLLGVFLCFLRSSSAVFGRFFDPLRPSFLFAPKYARALFVLFFFLST